MGLLDVRTFGTSRLLLTRRSKMFSRPTSLFGRHFIHVIHVLIYLELRGLAKIGATATMRIGTSSAIGRIASGAACARRSQRSLLTMRRTVHVRVWQKLKLMQKEKTGTMLRRRKKL